MSFWNLLCEAFILNKIWNLFSGKSKSCQISPSQPHYEYAPDVRYDACIAELEQEVLESKRRIVEYQKMAGIDGSAYLCDDIDELQYEIDELESQLDDCDDLSDQYDDIQERIDVLQNRLEVIEYQRDLQDDIFGSYNAYLDGPYNDLDEMDIKDYDFDDFNSVDSDSW